MQRIHRAVVGLCGLSLLLLLGAGCGQNRGGRCQVISDCENGLQCVGGPTGNGTCQPPGVTEQTGTDAAITGATGADVASASGPELPPATSEVAPEGEAGAIDTGE